MRANEMTRLTYRLFCLFLLFTLAVYGKAQPSVQKPKRIYITLDVSESMAGNKYIMANYAAQLISVFAGEEDRVSLYYFGQKQPLESILKPFEQLDSRKKRSYNEISDLTQFLQDYRPEPRYEDWLFIIGDGDWSLQRGRYDSKTEFDATWARIASSPWFGDGRLHVCYLQTGETLEDQTVFTEALSQLKTQPNHSSIDIRKSDNSAQSVRENCIYFANRILGFSIESIAIQQSGAQCVSFRSEFPLERFILLYQSVADGKLEIASVSFGTESIPGENIVLKGNPTTEPLTGPDGPLLNGAVWEINYPPGIPANEEVRVCFNQPVEASNLSLYPYVDVLLRMLPCSEALDTLMAAGPDLYKISDEENRVVVKISATDKNGHKIPAPVMQHLDVKLMVEGVEVLTAYSAGDTTFQAILDMPRDTLSYFSLVESPGYFSRITPSQTVLKSADLRPPVQVPLIPLPAQEFDAVSFRHLIEGSPFGGTVRDSLYSVLAPFGAFDIHDVIDLSDYPYAGNVELSLQPDGTLAFTHVPNSSWCECAFPDMLQYEVVLRASQGFLHDGNVYEGFRIPVTVPLDKRGWWARCRWYVALIVAILLFLLYLFALLKKNRFHKGARLKNSYYSDDAPKEVERNGKRLREQGPLAWFSRWFNPFSDERVHISFARPQTGKMTFIATPSKNRINLDAASFNPKTMTIPNYLPPRDPGKADKHERIPLSSGSSMEIKKVQGGKTTRLGHLKYVVEGKDSEGGFRFFVGLLILIGIGLIGLCTYILIKGL